MRVLSELFVAIFRQLVCVHRMYTSEVPADGAWRRVWSDQIVDESMNFVVMKESPSNDDRRLTICHWMCRWTDDLKS